jgi:hypothetical protein
VDDAVEEDLGVILANQSCRRCLKMRRNSFGSSTEGKFNIVTYSEGAKTSCVQHPFRRRRLKASFLCGCEAEASCALGQIATYDIASPWILQITKEAFLHLDNSDSLIVDTFFIDLGSRIDYGLKAIVIRSLLLLICSFSQA